MLSAARFFGGSTNISTGTGFTLDYRARLWLITMTAGSQTVSFPPITDPRNKTGTKIFYIVNAGSNSFNLRDFESTDSAFPVALAANKCAIIIAYKNPGLKWFADIRTWDPT